MERRLGPANRHEGSIVMHLPKLTKLFLLTLLAPALLVGCGEGDDRAEEECEGRGHLHDDHCHCDQGYEPAAEDGQSCVPVDPGTGGAGGSGTDVAQPCDIPGNIGPEELPDHGSVAFVIVDGAYRFIKKPAAEDTSIAFIDSRCEYAYGWSRDKPFDDDTSRESSWVLDLSTMSFTDIDIRGASWVVLRNGLDDGTVVGKLSIDNGTPEDSSDDESRGFIHDVATGQTQLVARTGFSDIGFTSINEAGVVVGFNDFGSQGFTWADGTFRDLNHDEAFRLFPFQVSATGTIVGFWGESEETWYESAVNPAFIAEMSDEELVVRRFALDGYSGTGLTGLNAAGSIAGIAYASPTSLPVVFHADSVEAAPIFHPLLGDMEPFPTGISASGVIHGQVFLLEEPRPCGGHGTPDGETCVCDDGFDVDPYDAANCLPPDPECSGHGHLHGDTCHCDDGFKKDPDDAARCVPN